MKKFGVVSSSPVSERSRCMVAKHGRHQAQQPCHSTSNDNGMVRWICDLRLEQLIRTQELHENVCIINIPEEIRWYRLRYFGHLQRMDANVRPRRVNDFVIPGSLSRERLYLHWSDVIIKDLKDLKGRTGWHLGAMARGDQSKEDTITKSGAHQRWTSTINNA